MKQTPNLLKSKHALHLLGERRLAQTVVKHNSNTSCAYMVIKAWMFRSGKSDTVNKDTSLRLLHTRQILTYALGGFPEDHKKCSRYKSRAVNTDLVLV